MAKGIDSYAHAACLKKGGLTIAMLGNGLDICYPNEHRKLMDKIIANGAIISEYPPGTRPKSCYFPRRNLLICAWAHKILVIEAGAKSGCLITAKYGKKYGRKTLAVPNNIYQSESVGSNQLIHKGADIFLNKGQLLLEQDDKNNENDFKEVTNSQHRLNKDKIIDNDLDNKKSLEELIKT